MACDWLEAKLIYDDSRQFTYAFKVLLRENKILAILVLHLIDASQYNQNKDCLEFSTKVELDNKNTIPLDLSSTDWMITVRKINANENYELNRLRIGGGGVSLYT